MQRGQPGGWRIILQIQSLGILYTNVPWSCRPYQYSNSITCTDSTIAQTEDEGLSTNIWCYGASDVKSWNSPVVPRSEKNSAGWTTQLRTLWPRGAAKKKNKEENEIFKYDSPAVMKNRMSHFRTTRPHVMMVTLSLERETRFLPGRFFLLRKKYSLQQQNFSLFLMLWNQRDCRHLFSFYALVDIVVRFFDTNLSLLICLFVIEVKRKEVVTMTSLRYSSKT